MIHMKEVRRTPWQPTRDDIQRELDRLGLLQTEAADLLRINQRSFRRYLQDPGTPGHAVMPFSSFVLLRLMKKDTAR